jgi:hypothetical protein
MMLNRSATALVYLIPALTKPNGTNAHQTQVQTATPGQPSRLQPDSNPTCLITDLHLHKPPSGQSR